MEEESHKAKKAYAEMMLNTAKESAARVMLSERKSARFHHDLSETKGEALRLLVRLKHMIDAKTIEAEVVSSSQQRQIDVLEAQLHEAEDIITDLRSEVSWVRDRLEKAKAFESRGWNLVNMEEEEEEEEVETVSAHEVVVESSNPSSLHDVECENDEKQFDGFSVVDTLKAYESQERNVVSEEEGEMVSVHEVDPKVVLGSLNHHDQEEDRNSLDGTKCGKDENLEKAKACESQESKLVNMEEEEMVSAQKVDPEVVVIESMNTADQEDHSSAQDVECEDDENLEKAKASELQEQNIVNKEDETVSAQEVVVESVNPDQEDRSSCENDENLEKAKASESQERNLVTIEEEEETVSAQKKVAVLESLKPNQEVADTCEIHDVECENDEKPLDGLSVVDTVMGNDVCESELDGDIRIKKLELSRNGCTQRIHALERKSSSSANEEEQEGTTQKDSEENLNLENTRCLVLALRASSAEVITLPSLGIKITKKLRGRRRKRRFGKPKAKSVRSQSQLMKPCQSQSTNVTSSKTSTSDGEDSHLSVESEEVDDDLKTCKELKEDLQLKRSLESGGISKGKKSKNMHQTDHFVEPYQESNLVSVNVEHADIPEKETKIIKQLPRLTPRKEDVLVDVLIRCEGEEEDSVIPSTKTASNLANLRSDSKVTAVVSDHISEAPPRAHVNRLLMYTFQRKRKRGSANINEDSNKLPRKHQENKAQDHN